MGNSNQHNYLYEDYATLPVNSIGKSLNPKISYIFTDPEQYPQSGLILVSNESTISEK